jgi:hypothetical protein
VKAAVFKYVFPLAMATVSASAISAKSVATWPAHSGDFIAYLQSSLPAPVTIYLYTSGGQLLNVVDTNGHNDPASISKVEKLLASGGSGAGSHEDFSKIDHRFRTYLADQGLRIKDLLNTGTKRTLIIAQWKLKPSDCVVYAKYEREYAASVRRFLGSSRARGQYSVTTLDLGSPYSKFTCAK